MQKQSRTLVVNCAALSPELIADASLTPNLAALAGRGGLRRLQPTFPAVTCSVQASMLTGRPPAEHGIVGNGFYLRDLAEVRMWEQPAYLLDAPYAWTQLQNRPTVAMLFWQNSMFAPVDIMLTPKPMHAESGLILDCYGRPASLYADLKARLGEFPLQHYWGPMSGLPATRWIASATAEVWRNQRPDICLTYLPLMDYNTQRCGPSLEHKAVADDLAALDVMVGELASMVNEDGGRLVVLSEYGLTAVSRAVALNRVLREAGLLAVRELAGREYLDAGASRAFALVDHQVAHIYLPGRQQGRATGAEAAATAARVVELLSAVDGVAEVLDQSGMQAAGINHRRSGDLVCVSQPGAWFSYYWWLDDAAAPDFARTVDIHNKPGYDPVELFVDRATRNIPLDDSLVRGSHGRAGPGEASGIYLDTHPPRAIGDKPDVAAVNVAELLGLA